MSETLEVTLGGETYQLADIVLSDHRNLENFIRSERLSVVKEALDEGSDDRARAIQGVLNSEIDVQDHILKEYMVGYVLWLSARHSLPDLDRDSFIDKLKLEDMNELMILVMKLFYGKIATEDESGELIRPPVESTAPASE